MRKLCYIAGNFFFNSTHSHWLLQGHMTSNNKAVSRQNRRAGNIAKSMIMSEGNSALLPTNVDRGLMNFKLQNFQLYNIPRGQSLI